IFLGYASIYRGAASVLSDNTLRKGKPFRHVLRHSRFLDQPCATFAAKPPTPAVDSGSGLMTLKLSILSGKTIPHFQRFGWQIKHLRGPLAQAIAGRAVGALNNRV